MEFTLLPRHQRSGILCAIGSDIWRQIPLDRDVIPDTLWRSIYFKCGKIERYCHPSSVILGKDSHKMELERNYEDLGKEVLSSKDTPDWKNVEENLQKLYNEYESAKREEMDKWLRRFTLLPKAKESRQIGFSMTQELHKHLGFTVEDTISKDTPDWKNVEESLQRMYDEHLSATYGKGRLAHDDGEPKRKIQIKVKTVKGLEHVFKGMSTRDLILDFKRKIASQIGGMVEDEIILLYGDKELCDNDTLDTYGITNGETVFMLQRLRRKGLMETARYLYNEARNVLKHLGEWVPGLFADSTRALTIKELSKVAQEIGMNWELLGPALGLDSVQMDHITEDNPSSTVKKIYTMLTIWLNENQGEATVGKLYQAMNDCKKVRFNWTKIKNIFSDVDAVFISG